MTFYRKNRFYNSFHAQVLMCEHHKTESGLGYWTLRLLCGGTMIDAFHWDKTGRPARKYEARDELLVSGRWVDKKKSRFQIRNAEVVLPAAANEPFYYGVQLELDLQAKPPQ